MKKIFLVLILLFFFTSCEKDNIDLNNKIKEEKNIQNKEYSYEELKDVFAISGNFCKGDILYKNNRLKNDKDYSDYYFGMFTPTKEEQKKYEELTKVKIYGNENPINFLAKHDMYCLGNFFDGSDIFTENNFKYQYLKKYYTENKEANDIVNILKNSKEINLNNLTKILNFSKKVPLFYDELLIIYNGQINLENIYDSLNSKKEKEILLKIFDNITRYTRRTIVFSKIIDFYKKNNLLELKKQSLLKDLEYKKNHEGFLDFDFDMISNKLE